MPRPEGKLLQFPGGDQKEQQRSPEGREIQQSGIVETGKTPEQAEQQKLLDMWDAGEVASKAVDRFIELGMQSVGRPKFRSDILGKEMQRIAKACPKTYLKHIRKAVAAMMKTGFDDDFKLIESFGKDDKAYDVETLEKRHAHAKELREQLRKTLLEMMDDGPNITTIVNAQKIVDDGLKKFRELEEVGGFSLASIIRDEATERLMREADPEKVVDAEHELLLEIRDPKTAFQVLPDRIEPDAKKRQSSSAWGDATPEFDKYIESSLYQNVSSEVSDLTTPGLMELCKKDPLTANNDHLYYALGAVGTLVKKIKALARAGEVGMYEEKLERGNTKDTGRRFARVSVSSQRAERFAQDIDRTFIETLYHLKTMEEVKTRFGQADRIEAMKALVRPSQYGELVKSLYLAAQKGLYQKPGSDQEQSFVAS